MAVNQKIKAATLRELHRHGETFVIANAWNVGSAKQLAGLGFQALATTSSGIAMEMGLEDGQVGRAATLAVSGKIAAAVNLPVSADLENCFADDPEGCAQTIRDAIAVGLAGGSIEDYTGNKDNPIYPLEQAVARVRAAVGASRGGDANFVLTARAENYFRGRFNLPDTIARLQAFEAAGADVLFAPGLPDLEAIKAVRSALAKPMNVLLASSMSVTVQDLQAAGIERVSLGGRLARAAAQAIEDEASRFR